MPLVIYSLIFGSVALLGVASSPALMRSGNTYLKENLEEGVAELEGLFTGSPAQQLKLVYVGAPLVLRLAGWTLTGSWVIAGILAIAGLGVPNLFLQYAQAEHRQKFHDQLVDVLLQISSCLRAGLSMTQALEAVIEELPPPASYEFGFVLKELRMGVSLEDALLHLKQRVPSEDMTLFVTTVLVARETGGDITAVFAKLIETVRERKKMQERIKTLTLMPRMQAIIMAIIPLVFLYVTYSLNAGHVEFFLNDRTGKLWLAGIVGAQLVSWSLLAWFSRSPL